MARTHSAAVTAAISTSVDFEHVDAFIDTASLWVDENLVGKGVSEALLTEIEKYLACHFVTLRDPRLASAVLDDVEERFQRDAEVTEYLKAAIALDPTGLLKEAFEPRDDTFPALTFVGKGYA